MSDQADDMFKLLDMVQDMMKMPPHDHQDVRFHEDCLGCKARNEECEECEECGHAIKLHDDPYGCQYERGDSLAGGHNSHGEECDPILMAMGPCGCMEHAPKIRESEADTKRLDNLQRRSGC